jgi:hypothetical protein
LEALSRLGEANQYQEAMAAFETSEANFLGELQQLS